MMRIVQSSIIYSIVYELDRCLAATV